MYDRRLDSFIKVIECGSFAAAGEALFVSGNAIMKQMNSLESDLGVRLFDRGRHGASLTPAGKKIYEAALPIIDASLKAVKSAKRLDRSEERCVRLATSIMSPATRISRWWSAISSAHPGIQLEIVPVADDQQSWIQLFNDLGYKADVMVFPEPLEVWTDRSSNVLRPLFRSPACAYVPLGHHLAGQSKMTIADLEGECVYVVARGYNPGVERIRDAIEASGVHVDVIDYQPYDVSTFNDAAREGALVVHCLELGSVHPGFAPVELEGFSILYCLEHSKICGDAVREFAVAICERAALDQANVPNPPMSL